MKRRIARELLMKAFYEMEIKKEYLLEILEKNEEFLLSAINERDFILLMAKTFIENKEDIDHRIENHLKGWTLDRVSKVDLSIIRVAATEMLYIEDIDAATSINEAIEISKAYSEEKSSQFINGVLDSVKNNKTGD